MNAGRGADDAGPVRRPGSRPLAGLLAGPLAVFGSFLVLCVVGPWLLWLLWMVVLAAETR